MKKSKFTDSQILAVLKQAEAGTAVPALCREHGISTATFYKWRSKFGGMDASLMGRMKELEEENRRLKKLYIEAQIKADIISEARLKKTLRPSRRREVARWAVEERGRTSRFACEAFGLSESVYRYRPQRNVENDRIGEWLVRLTKNVALTRPAPWTSCTTSWKTVDRSACSTSSTTSTGKPCPSKWTSRCRRSASSGR